MIEKTFFSLKNQTQYFYQTNPERLMMSLLEFDVTVDSYSPFEFKMVSTRSFNEIETAPGFTAIRAGAKEFIVLSDRLAANRTLTNVVKAEMQRSEPAPIHLTVHRPGDIEHQVLAKNVAFLYQYAIDTPSANDVHAVKDYFSYVTDSSIARLKRFLQSDHAIYHLLFHYGLRADLSFETLTEDTIVTVGPLISSVLKGLGQAVEVRQ